MKFNQTDMSSHGTESESLKPSKVSTQNSTQHAAIEKQLAETFNHFFKYFTIIAVIGTSISAMRIRETGFLVSYPTQWFCVLMLILVVRFQKKIPFQKRVASFWILGMIFGATGIFAHGFLGQGFLVLLLACVVATIGGRKMHGYIVAVISAIVTIAAGIAFYQGWLVVQINPSNYIVSIVPWITTASAITIISILTVNFLGNVKELWIENINNLELSETRYRLLFESAADAILIMHGDKFIDSNDKALEIFGCTREQLIGETPYRFSPERQPDGKLSSEKANEKLSEALAGEPQFFEWTHIRYDGTPFEAEVSLNKLKLGRETHIQAITRDITKRKNAERELQNKERQQSLILRSLPMAFYVAQPFGEYGGKWVSEQIEKLTGYSPDHFIADKGFWAARIHPDDKQQTMETFDQITEKEIIEPVYRWQIADGSYRWIRDVAALIRDEDGEPKEIVGTWVDITEHKQLQEEINRSTAKFIELTDMLPLIVFETDINARLSFYNRQAYELLGYTKEDFDKIISVVNFIAPEDKEKAVQNMQSIMAGEISMGNEYSIVRKDGSRFPAFIYSKLEKSGDDPVGLRGFIVDITERKKADEEKETLSAQLRQAQKLEAIGTLAGGIAHDFNNILTPLLLHAEMSLLDLPTDSTILHHLEEVLSAGHRAKNLVRQILDFSRKSEQEIIPLQFNLICKEVIKFIRASIPVTVKIQQDLRDTSYILADPVQMHQVILNLCTNAAHAMKKDKKGLLELNLTRIAISNEDLRSLPDLKTGNYLKLSVRDTGYGMTKEVLERIFDPFFTTKERGEGTGLGLSVVHGIIISYEGAITVKSEPKNGSTFTVYLPVLKKYELKHSKKSGSFPRGSERILFVDDEVKLVEANKEMLSMLGYEVFDCTDPHKCLDIFRKNPGGFDLVITDMTMPGMTGTELVKEIYKTRPDIPVIITSGYLTDDQKLEMKALGIKKIIAKPIFMNEMAVTIRESLENI